MTDAEIIELYRRWSEETYCAGFMHADSGRVAEFRAWLPGPMGSWAAETAKLYELEMLAEYRRQEENYAER